MAEFVVGIGSSHSPILTIPPEHWSAFAEGDRGRNDLTFPPDGMQLAFADGVERMRPAMESVEWNEDVFSVHHAACEAAVQTLAETLREVEPDVVVVVSDDQDEWLFEDNMPSFSMYWGETMPLIPPPTTARFASYRAESYGDVRLDVPVDSEFAYFMLEYFHEHDFDFAHFRYVDDQHGGSVGRRFPTPTGVSDAVKTTPVREQGMPHGFAFVVKRLFGNAPPPIVPIFQNTCYPPTSVTPRRCYRLGRTLAEAIKAWPRDVRVAVIASGGLSHWVVDEEIDRAVLDALAGNDADALQSLPSHRLRAATSESLNWVTLGGAVSESSLRMELVDYVASIRTEGATGGGWAFARWLP